MRCGQCRFLHKRDRPFCAILGAKLQLNFYLTKSKRSKFMLNMNYAKTAQRWLSLLRIVPLSYGITFFNLSAMIRKLVILCVYLFKNA